MNRLYFTHPRPVKPRPRLRPVFLPHLGCPGRCLFCDQQAQSGQKAGVNTVLEELSQELDQRLSVASEPLELGFYAGTFTGLPLAVQERCLNLAAQYRQRGAVHGVRVSTRPDGCDLATLTRLRQAGVTTIELGVQSYRDAALVACQRGYDGASALAACRQVQQAGLGLVVHLMAGLPGVERNGVAAFLTDVDQTAALAPDGVRLHPCLVLAGTGLEAEYRAGRYRPWSLTTTLRALALAVERLWRADIAVTRMGLAAEASLLAARVAGPWHPALGQRVASRVLAHGVAQRLVQAGGPPVALHYPRRWQSEVLGWRQEMLPVYARLGLPATALRPCGENFFLLQTD